MSLVGLISNERTWITEFGFQNADVMTQYILSLYWTFTTLLTVGYGKCRHTVSMHLTTLPCYYTHMFLILSQPAL